MVNHGIVCSELLRFIIGNYWDWC